MKIAIVIGARPNFVKLSPLIDVVKMHPSLIPLVIHTGQHYDTEMSHQFFQELAIPEPDYNLEVGSGKHGWQTAKIMERLEPIVIKEKPNWVMVLGDINSTIAGALVAAKLGIPVAHVESGMRSYKREMPEEINRVVTDHLSRLLFCSTNTAVENLKKEGIVKKVYNVGDIMYDVFLKNIKVAEETSRILSTLQLVPRNYLLLTIHRTQNADNPENLRKILHAMQKVKEQIIFPVHPRTKKQLDKMRPVEYQSSNLKLIEPVGYLDMLLLENHAKKIITDSGGVQKEAYWSSVPCITLRDETEWIETLKNRWNVLVGTDAHRIAKAIKEPKPKVREVRVFGNGKSAQKIIAILKKEVTAL